MKRRNFLKTLGTVACTPVLLKAKKKKVKKYYTESELYEFSRVNKCLICTIDKKNYKSLFLFHADAFPLNKMCYHPTIVFLKINKNKHEKISDFNDNIEIDWYRMRMSNRLLDFVNSFKVKINGDLYYNEVL
jgi:hypothetical protein